MSKLLLKPWPSRSGLTQLENGGSFHSCLYVYQRVIAKSFLRELEWCCLFAGHLQAQIRVSSFAAMTYRHHRDSKFTKSTTNKPTLNQKA